MVLRLRTAVKTFTVKVLTFLLRWLGAHDPLPRSATVPPQQFGDSPADPVSEAFVRSEVTRAMAYAFGSKEQERRTREDDRTVPHGVFGLNDARPDASRRVIDGPSSLTAPRF